MITEQEVKRIMESMKVDKYINRLILLYIYIYIEDVVNKILIFLFENYAYFRPKTI